MVAAGLLLIVLDTCLRLTAIAMVARASLGLRAAIGRMPSRRAFAVAAICAIVPGDYGKLRNDPDLAGHFELFGRRWRIAIALYVADLLLRAGFEYWSSAQTFL
jgi:hypothetical protein